MTALFRYAARSSTGRTERGAIEAPSRSQALARLRARGLTAYDVSPARAREPRLTDAAARDLARTLAQLLKSGLPISRALQFASEELRGAAGAAATRIQEQVARGERPSTAFDADRSAPGRMLRGVLIAGEASGRVVEALEFAAGAFARTADLGDRVRTALIYPSFVLAATTTTMMIFVLFVTPALGQAFEGSYDRLPDLTRLLLSVSAWLRTNGALLGLALSLFLAAAIVVPRIRELVADTIDRLTLSPLGGGIAPRFEFATFARLSALAISSGAPIGAGFDAASAGMRSAILRRRLARAISAIRVGERPSAAFERHCGPPRTLLKLMLVGEETGQLAQSLTHAADLMSAEAEQRLARWGAIGGPVIMLVLGSVVGTTVLSLFLGLMSLSDVAAAS